MTVIPAWIAGIQAPWMGLNLPFIALETRSPRPDKVEKKPEMQLSLT